VRDRERDRRLSHTHLRFHAGEEKRGTSVCLSCLVLTGVNECEKFKNRGGGRGRGWCSYNNRGFQIHSQISLTIIQPTQPADH
jgi:hypothetical protein